MSHDHAPRQVADAPARARAEAARPAPPVTSAHAVPSPDETVTDAPSAFAGPARSDRLPPALQIQMGAAFGLDLAAVPVIARSPAAEAHDAEAIATGGALHFAPGRYDPSSASGRALIGHEVAHLRQQTDGRAAGVQARRGGGEPDPLEREADALGERAARGEVGLLGAGPPRPPRATAVVQRKPTLWTAIHSNKAGVIWDPHRTDIDKVTGVAQGTGATFTTPIVYAGPGQAAPSKGIQAGGLGVSVEALGPGHPAGAALDPTWTTPAALDFAANAVAATAKKTAPTPYVPVQLLPAALGGDGHAHNAMALPPDAAKKVVNRLHAVATRLVAVEGGTIQYRLDVAEGNDAGVPYVKEVKAGWAQLGGMGAPIPGTAGEYTVEVPSPSKRVDLESAKRTQAATIGTHANQATLKPGALAAAGPAEAKSKITFGPVHASGDGTKMVADPFGPDHKIGDQPGKDTKKATKIWNDRTAALEAASGGKMVYIAGHLLNHHLGGPGDDPRNLAAIPSDANDLHESKVEKIIKELVNDHHAWVHYEIVVNFAKDNIGTASAPVLIDYASAFVAQWWQLDAAGQKIPGTAGHRTIVMNAPTAYKAASIATNKTLPNLATAPVTLLESQHATLHERTPTTTFGYDEALLEDSTTLRARYWVLQPLIEELHRLGLNALFATNGALQSSVYTALAAITPSVAEAKARDEIERLIKELGELTSGAGSAPRASLAKIDELEEQLTAFRAEFDRRHARTVPAVAELYLHYREDKAKDYAGKLQAALDQGARDVEMVSKLAAGMIASARRTTGEFIGSDSALRHVSESISTAFKTTALPEDATPQQHELHGAQTVEAAGEKLERNRSKKRTAEGELRHAAWLTSATFGQPPADQRATPKELREHVQSTLAAAQEQQARRDEEARQLLQLSPAQALALYGERFQGKATPGSGNQARGELLAEHLESDDMIVDDGEAVTQGRRKRTKVVPDAEPGADAMLALIKKVVADDQQPWPHADAGSGLDDDVLDVAALIEGAVGSGRQGAIEKAVRSLYAEQTRAFTAYLTWVKVKVTS